MLVLPAVARTAGQCSWLEKIRKRMSLHKPLQIPPLGQFVSDILGPPPIPNTKQSMLAMRLMSTLRQKKLRFGSSGKAPDLAINQQANARGRALFAMLPPTRRSVKRPMLFHAIPESGLVDRVLRWSKRQERLTKERLIVAVVVELRAAAIAPVHDLVADAGDKSSRCASPDRRYCCERVKCKY